MTEPSGIDIRPATPDELAAAARVYLIAEDDLLARTSGRAPRNGAPEGADVVAAAYDDLATAAADCPERVLVALDRGEVIGFAAWRVWDQWWFLGYLFVLPAYQGRAIGRALLERAYAGGVAAGCASFSLFASGDPRGLRRYLALGLQPQPPIVDLRAPAAALRSPPPRTDDNLESCAVEFDGLESATLETLGDLDRVIRGARRLGDLRRWLQAGATGALVTEWESGKPAGYYIISAPRATDGGFGRIGPVVALEIARFPAILARALAAAAESRTDIEWRVSIPGQNQAAIAPLFAAGFRPRALENYLVSGPIGLWDRYVPRNEDDL